MKKITPVFGPQELFNGAANCDEYLVAVQHSVGQKTKVSFYPSLVEAFNYVVDFPPRGVVFHRAAMRKIEEVPDSQLVTDGMPSFYVGSSGACTHKMAESDIPVWCNDVDDTCTAMGFINDCLRLTRKPKLWTVEDQKASRLENDFVDSIMCDEHEPNMSEEAKEWAIHVLKCAYRKLKKDGQ